MDRWLFAFPEKVRYPKFNDVDIDEKIARNWNEKKEITFDELVKAIRVTSEASQASALKAINRMLTMRNWLIGYYIVKFEQKGKERAWRQTVEEAGRCRESEWPDNDIVQKFTQILSCISSNGSAISRCSTIFQTN